MSTGHIGGNQLKASSYFNLHHPGAVRYGSVKFGTLQNSWKPNPVTAVDQWIQVDLLAEHVITRKLVFFS